MLEGRGPGFLRVWKPGAVAAFIIPLCQHISLIFCILVGFVENAFLRRSIQWECLAQHGCILLYLVFDRCVQSKNDSDNIWLVRKLTRFFGRLVALSKERLHAIGKPKRSCLLRTLFFSCFCWSSFEPSVCFSSLGAVCASLVRQGLWERHYAVCLRIFPSKLTKRAFGIDFKAVSFCIHSLGNRFTNCITYNSRN